MVVKVLLSYNTTTLGTEPENMDNWIAVNYISTKYEFYSLSKFPINDERLFFCLKIISEILIFEVSALHRITIPLSFRRIKSHKSIVTIRS